MCSHSPSEAMFCPHIEHVALWIIAPKDTVDKGVHCGNIVKSIAQVAGGKGGGRPNMAQAGAPDVWKVDEALNHASEVLKSLV